MADDTSLANSIARLRGVCSRAGQYDLVSLLVNMPFEDPLSTWERFLEIQDLVRDKLCNRVEKQLKIDEEKAALLSLNKRIAVVVELKLKPHVPKEKAEELMKKRRHRYIEQETSPSTSYDESSSDEKTKSLSSSSDEEIVFCATKRQRND